MQEYHIITENPSGSNIYTPTGEVITTYVADAVARCVELAGLSPGDKFGCWVYESIDADAILPVGGIGAEDTGTTRGVRKQNLPADTDKGLPGKPGVIQPVPPEPPATA
jgi:hypothetical protein